MLSDTDIYIAELELELGGLCLIDESEKDEQYSEAEIKNLKAKSQVVNCRSIKDLPGFRMVRMAAECVHSIRSTYSTDFLGEEADIHPSNDDRVDAYENEAQILDQSSVHNNFISNEHIQKDPLHILCTTNRNRDGEEAARNLDDIPINDEPDMLLSDDASEDELDKSFDRLIQEATSDIQHHDSALRELQKQHEIDRKKIQEALAIKRSARMLQRCAQRYLFRRKQILSRRLQRMCIIATKIRTRLGLGQWLQFIQTRKKAGKILVRFCRVVSLRCHCKLLALKQAQRNVQAIIVFVNGENVHEIRLYHSSYGIPSMIQFIHTGDLHLWYCSTAKFLPSAITEVTSALRKMKVSRATSIPVHMVQPRELARVPKTKLYTNMNAGAKMRRVIYSIVIRRSFMRFQVNHTQKSNAAVQIQRVYRSMASRMIVLRRRRHIYRAAVLIQRIYRGFVARRRLRNFRGVRFKYNDNDLDCILSDDINHLLDFSDKKEEIYSFWVPCKPICSLQNNNRGLAFNEEEDFSILHHTGVGDEKEETNENEGYVVANDSLETHHSSLLDSDRRVDAAPNINRRESNRFMKQWRVSDKQIAEVSYQASCISV